MPLRGSSVKRILDAALENPADPPVASSPLGPCLLLLRPVMLSAGQGCQG
jgi:hypothetical protein